MRIWDIHPGYLNRQSLLGEHRELHGIHSIIVHHKKGYSRHPETRRWVGYEWALKMRHDLLAAEMAIRGFNEKTPIITHCNDGNQDIWPQKYINSPQEQFLILAEKYTDKEQGRIPLPQKSHQLWSQHKYSIMARNISLYKSIGKKVAQPGSAEFFPRLATQLTEMLRTAPSEGGIRNALQHMWGYVSDFMIENDSNSTINRESWSLSKLLSRIQQGALKKQDSYLLASTALTELAVWIPGTWPKKEQENIQKEKL
jgi:hypothetical protein